MASGQGTQKCSPEFGNLASGKQHGLQAKHSETVSMWEASRRRLLAWGQQHIVELDVAVDDERRLRVQEGQAVCHLRTPLQSLRVAVHHLHEIRCVKYSTSEPSAECTMKQSRAVRQLRVHHCMDHLRKGLFLHQAA